MDRNEAPTPARPSIRLAGTEQSEHDALAELFLGDAAFAPAPMEARPEPARGAEPPRPRFEGTAVRAARSVEDAEEGRPLIELVVLGHLPVRASLWVRQYACLSARKRNETVALVRATGGSVAVDVITGRDAARIDPVSDVETGVTIARHAASRVVLRVDETAEPELLERPGVDEVTILTGTDEAAVVASYRLIKTLAAALDDRLDPESGPRLRLALMGTPGPDIEAARQKIAKACKAFLDRPIEILDASGRLDATGTVTVCRSDEPHAAETALEALLGDGSFAPPAPLRLADEPIPAPVQEIPAAPEVVVRLGAHGAGAERRSEAERAPAQAPSAIAEPAGVRMPRSLAGLVEGLTPIESRCPAAPGVELACDADGRLHALATDANGAGEAVASLLTASAWARSNLALLIRAEPGVAMPSPDPDEDHDAVLHLLARRPSAARSVLETGVLVYALASARVGGEEALVATPLND